MDEFGHGGLRGSSKATWVANKYHFCSGL